MKFAVISSLDIAKCPTHCLNAQHWIGGHHVEECDPKLVKMVKRYEDKQIERTKRTIEQVRKLQVKRNAAYRNKLRRQP